MRRFQCALLAAVALIGFTSIASAADMAVKARPMAPAPAALTWTGCYIGAHIGGARGHDNWTTIAGPFAEHDISGFIGGGQIGCNYQTGALVLGVEGELSGASVTGSSTEFNFGGAQNWRSETKLDFLASATARAGYAWNSLLLYGKGGVAWTTDHFNEINVVFPAVNTFAPTDHRTGWTAGVGLEYMFARNWSVKAEYAYYDFGKKENIFRDAAGGTFDNFIQQTLHTVKVGVNLHF